MGLRQPDCTPNLCLGRVGVAASIAKNANAFGVVRDACQVQGRLQATFKFGFGGEEQPRCLVVPRSSFGF